MAATELNRPCPAATARQRPLGLGSTVALTYLVLWAVTLTAAAMTRALDLTGPVRGLLGARLSSSATPAPTLSEVAAFALHNLPVCGWPLLLPAAGATRSVRGTLIADALLAASITANVMLVGAALGAYGPRLLAYTPQLPVEWLALAAGAAGWFTYRTRRHRRTLLKAASLVLAAVLAAGALETYAIPHTASLRCGAAAAGKREGGQACAVSDIQLRSHT